MTNKVNRLLLTSIMLAGFSPVVVGETFSYTFITAGYEKILQMWVGFLRILKETELVWGYL